MAQRRKIEVSVSNSDGNKPEVDASFQIAANGVTKLYHQAMNLQQVAFDAGRRHSLVKAFEWVSSKAQDGKLVTSSEFMAYLQHELNTSLAISHQELSENVPCCQDQDMGENTPHV
ncbi:hypothetical protein L2E82_28944 [Cichorium intybus]|uniref:Uncharacterized protein n=1 Tax=Cichorium intybus TaxID=13427 RepID=A0ACB9CWT1_CICIN|nr:hypothetical protein L1887_18817 [Cichorium endivia]KAI3738787.1 hypothetical protein L2E82_28944 [Cichorium intybus]